MSEACKYQHDCHSKKQRDVKNVHLKDKTSAISNFSSTGGQFQSAMSLCLKT